MHFFIIGALASYTISAILYLFSIKHGKLQSVGTWLFKLAFVLQSISLFLLLRSQNPDSLLSSGDFYFWLSWALSVVYILCGDKVHRATLGACIAGTSIFLIVSSSIVAHHELVEVPATQDRLSLLGLHVVPALIAEAFLLFSFLLSLVFLFQDNRLKKRNINSVTLSGPSLGGLEKLTSRFLLLGFIAMSVALGSGAIWAFNAHRGLFKDLLAWSAFVSWLVLGIILHAKLQLNWSHRKIAALTVLVVGVFFACLIVILVSDNGSSFHGIP